jgi:hypothetical protein
MVGKKFQMTKDKSQTSTKEPNFKMFRGGARFGI